MGWENQVGRQDRAAIFGRVSKAAEVESESNSVSQIKLGWQLSTPAIHRPAGLGGYAFI